MAKISPIYNKLLGIYQKSIINKLIKNLTFEKIIKVLFIGFATVVFITLSINKYINSFSREYVYSSIDKVPQAQTAVILGALVYSDGSLSDILADRAETAIDLYEAKKVEKILISGDHGRKEYDEVNSIKTYLVEQGIPPEDIFMDHAGFDTYDSMYRAKEIFEVDSIIIVTQKFHLPRSIYIARNLDLDAVGIESDKHVYMNAKRIEFREKLAKVKAFFDILVDSSPKYGGPKIPITGDSKLSWD
ncbi:hypothetical protein GF362_03745 [Candidatus Dojkabacteria bacterium]|nr:hypothetical protein [Candidatus Dojkabacteria bacterium]